MAVNTKPNPLEFKFLTQHLQEPVTFAAVSNNWCTWDLNTWSEQFNTKSLPFRTGTYIKQQVQNEPPQWERYTKTEYMTFTQFIEICKKSSPNWYYFDYKRLPDWCGPKSELIKNVSWAEYGYPELSANESTIWIGSKGAHTPCHIDTYESNLIMQIYGQKRWLLFPPDTKNIQPTRIPYEESSIYSKLNFFQPSLSNFQDLTGAREVILKPGNILFVPQGWWHYVENLSTAISINAWLPKTENGNSHLHEAIIQIIMSAFTRNMPAQNAKAILNPNNEFILTEPLHTLENHIQRFLVKRDSESITEDSFENSQMKINATKIADILNKYSDYIKPISTMTDAQFTELITNQRTKFSIEPNISGKSTQRPERQQFIEDLLNVLCSSEVIELIAQKLRADQ